MQVPTPTPPLEPTPNGDPQGQTPTPHGQTPNGKTPLDSLPPDVQDYIKSLRAEAEKANEKTKAEALAKKQAQAAAQAEIDRQLEEQGKHKELAEQYATRVRELEPVANRFDALSELLTEQIKATIKAWPDEVKSLVPGKETPIELRLEQVGKLQALADRLSQQATGQQPGNRPNPRPAHNMTPDEASQKALDELRSRSPGKYQL